MNSSAAQSHAVPLGDSYHCPGELYSISAETHLARLAAFYTKCRECPHRHAIGSRIVSTTELTTPATAIMRRDRVITDENVRGVFLNELDRNRAIPWGEAVAAHLWNLQPMMISRPPEDTTQIIAERPVHRDPSVARGPVVVVGFDERPSSPEIISGAVIGLRRMGCHVIDLGQSAIPTWAFHISQLDADAGLYVTGAGCDASWTGFEFLFRNGNRITTPELEQLQNSVSSGVSRQTRQIGRHQPQQGQAVYEASLESHFHAIRPLNLVCGVASRQMGRTLERLFERLPCDLTVISLPTRRRQLQNSRDIDLVRIAQSVVDERRHLGLIIDEDGQHICFITDRGRLVTYQQVARLLMEMAMRDSAATQYVVPSSWTVEAAVWLENRAATVIDGGESAQSLVQNLVEQHAALAASADGRVWFQETHPVCDALLVLASILRALSLSDTPFSDVIARLDPPRSA